MAAAPPPSAVPSSAANPFASAADAVKQRYKLLGTIPFQVEQGSGPYFSETYKPWDPSNPTPGTLNIQMRHFGDRPHTEADLQNLITGETFHYLGGTKPDGTPVNPQWYALKQKVYQLMPPHDLENQRRNWLEEQKNAKPEDRRSFEQFMQESALDQYIGGVMNPMSWEQEWIDRSRSLPKYAPQQSAVIEQLRQYLTTGQIAPNPNTDPQAYLLNKLRGSGVVR